MIYRGLDTQEHVVQFTEMDLDAFVQLSSPKDRLCSGQFDKKGAFELRVAAVNHLHALQSSPVKGLVGARTNHLAHQVYIASEVAQRYAPRVLLADEVGLGKTIEAGHDHALPAAHRGGLPECSLWCPNPWYINGWWRCCGGLTCGFPF